MYQLLVSLLMLMVLSACQVKSDGAASGIFVGHAPKDNKFTVTTPTPRSYSAGQNINFTLAFPVAVTVTGTPDFPLTIGTTARVATYVSGSGTSNLIFRYTVAAGETDSDGISMGTLINLNGGTLKYDTTLDCNLNLTPSVLSTVLVDNTAPTLTSVTAPVNGTYLLNQNMIFTAAFSEAVIVSGTPRLTLDINGVTRYANYVSGSGTSSLTFRYTITSTDQDLNGIGLFSPIDLNAGSIADAASLASSLAFTVPNTTSVLAAGDSPTILSVIPPADATYTNSQNMDFTVNFSENVNISGTPRLTLDIGGTTKYATYLSGSGTTAIIFRYVVIGGDLDSDGIGLTNAVDLNAGTIQDAGLNNALLNFSVPNLTGVKVFTTGPSIVSVAVPGSIPAGGFDNLANVDFTVTFSEAMTESGGTSRLQLNVGGVIKYAVYSSGSGTSAFIYRYTVATGDEDLNGLAIISPLELNGATILSGTAQAPSLGFTSPNSSTVLIDAKSPTISSNTVPANATYKATQNLDYAVTFHEPVTVVGTPRIVLDIGGVTKFANYLSGSGSSVLTFRYTVAGPDTDTDGIVTTANIDLNGGTIQDPKTHNTALTLVTTNTTLVLVDAVAPTITSVTPPANATYVINNNLDFTVNFSESVDVSGTPRIPLTIGATTRYASYLSGSGTSAIIFRYTVPSGDVDSDGIAMTSPLDLNGGTIQDTATNSATLTYTAPNTTGVLVDASVPYITSITPPANAKYIPGNVLSFTVNFSQNVVVTLVPRIAITLTSGTVYANYSTGGGSSALVFEYTVAAGEYDADGIVLVSPLEPNGGAIQNSGLTQNANLIFTPPTTTGVLVDGISPTISSVTGPANATYGIGANLDFTVTYTAPVDVSGSPFIPLTVGAASISASYLSGSGSSTLIFRYTVASGNVDTDGIASASPINLNGGTINDPFGDVAGLTFTAPTTTGVLVDGTVPTISSVTAPADATYRYNDNLDFTVAFSENINVTGSPRLTLTVGAATAYATYLSGAGTSSLIFRYTVPSTHQDLDGIVVAGSIDLNAGTLKDAGGNSVSPLTFTAPATTSVLVDGVTPYIISVSAPANATYKTTNNLDFVVTYSVAINVTGSPRIALTVGASTLYATYLSGSGTTVLTFRYTVAAGDSDADGIAMASSISLNGGTMQDGVPTNAQLTFTAPAVSGILVDGIDIVISSITPPADATYKIADALSFTVNYNYAATVTGTPRITLTVGAVTNYATYASGSGTTAHTFTYTVASGDVDADGIETVGPNLDLNGGSIKDSFGDSANVGFTGTTYANKKVDGVRPTVSSATVSANKTYLAGENIDFTLTYSESVTITGTPRLTLTVGASTLYADYNSAASTATAKVYRYTVASGNLDSDGIAASNTIDLNLGTIDDAAGNAQTPLTFTVPVLTGVLVDGVVPTITSITGPAAETYGQGANLDFVVNFSEAVTIAGGTPTLGLNIGGASRNASYLSGSGTSAVTFRYTAVLNDLDTNGVDVIASPVTLGTATIKDASGNNADLTFAGANYSGVLVDAAPPVVSSVTLPANASYQNGGANPTLTFTVTYNENVNVTGTPRINLTIGSTTSFANYASGTGTTSLTFSYSVASTQLDLDGIAVANSNNIDLNGGTMRDANLNDANLALGSLATAGIYVVFPSMRNWYDLSDSTKLTISGSNVTDLADKIGSYNFTHTAAGGIPYSATGFNGGSSGHATCNATTYFNNATAINQKAFLAVFKAPTTTAGNITWSGGNPQPRSTFATSNSINLGKAGGHYVGTAFGTGATTATSFWTTNGGEHLMRAVQWDTAVSKATRLCQMDGSMAELFFFSVNPTSAELDAIEAYLSVKHGGLMLP